MFPRYIVDFLIPSLSSERVCAATPSIYGSIDPGCDRATVHRSAVRADKVPEELQAPLTATGSVRLPLLTSVSPVLLRLSHSASSELGAAADRQS